MAHQHALEQTLQTVRWGREAAMFDWWVITMRKAGLSGAKSILHRFFGPSENTLLAVMDTDRIRGIKNYQRTDF